MENGKVWRVEGEVRMSKEPLLPGNSRVLWEKRLQVMDAAASAAERLLSEKWEEVRQRWSCSYTLGRDGDHLHADADLQFDEQGNLRHDVPWQYSALRLPLDVRGAAAVIRRQFSAAERVELLRLIKWGEAEPVE